VELMNWKIPQASGFGLVQTTQSALVSVQKTWPKAYFEDNKMHHLLARKGSTASLGVAAQLSQQLASLAR
jgi:hypothetical protein